MTNAAIIVNAALIPLAASGAPAADQTDALTTQTIYLSSPQALADLGRVNDQFIENFIRNDVRAHDALLHPQFMVINADGSRTNRADYLRRWATGFDPDIIPYWDVRDELITLIGNVALVRSVNRQVVHRDGQDQASMSTYTDTYVYENGRWLCIQAQITRVAAHAEPGDETIKTIYLRGVRQARAR